MEGELDTVRKRILEHRDELREKFAVKKIGVFGSVAKGSVTPTNDIDFLVEFEEPIGLFRFASLRLFLEDCFKKKVDLATPRALKSSVRDEIISSVVCL